VEIPTLKVCTKCRVPQSLDAFGTDNNTNDGKASRCVLCKRQESTQYRTQNPEKVRAATAKWTRDNPEKRYAYEQAHKTEKTVRNKARYVQNKALMNAQSAAYYQAHKVEMRQKHAAYEQAHKAEVRKRKAAWRAKHRQEINARLRVRYAKNIEKYHEKDRAYYWENREKCLAKTARYYATHPEAEQAKSARRRSRKANSPVNDLTAAQWQEIKDAYGHRCVYCHRKMQRLTQDHITPLSKGGAHTKTNVVPACQPCNSKKRDKAPLVSVQPLLFTITPSKPHTKRRKG